MQYTAAVPQGTAAVFPCVGEKNLNMKLYKLKCKKKWL